jgi:hypothetical protein
VGDIRAVVEVALGGVAAARLDGRWVPAEEAAGLGEGDLKRTA